MTPITLNLSALAALGEMDPHRRRRLAVSILAALSIAPEDLTTADEDHAAALSRIRELTSELDAATDRAERAEAALEASSAPLSVMAAGGAVAVAVADLAPLDTGTDGECVTEQPAADELTTEQISALRAAVETLADENRPVWERVNDVRCHVDGIQDLSWLPECPPDAQGTLQGAAMSLAVAILVQIMIAASGALAGEARTAIKSILTEALNPSEDTDDTATEAPPIAVEQPRAADLPGPVSGTDGLSLTAGSGGSLVTRSESVRDTTAPAISSATADPYSQGMDESDDPPSLSSSVDALLVATSAEPDALTEADLEPLDVPALSGDPETGWGLLGQAIGAGAELDEDWLAGALLTQQDGADLLAALDASALLPMPGPDIGALDADDRADLVALVRERIGSMTAWGMVWGYAGDGYVVARPWVYLHASDEARGEYVHRIPFEDWPDARRAWLDLEAATGLLLQRRDVLMSAIYLDEESEPPELRPARTGRGNLGAHVSQLGTPEICALARIEAPGLRGLGSPAGWAALYSDDERVRIAYQRAKGHRDHLALQRRANTTEAPEDRGWLGKLWSKQ